MFRKRHQAQVDGWNLGNQFECSAPKQDGESPEIGNPEGSIHAEEAWGNPVVAEAMIQAVKNAGFNAIRIPIRWQCHITDAQKMSIDPDWIARIKTVVGWCLKNDLKVIINAHHEKWLESRPTYQYKEENCQKLALLWMNIASEFANYDSRLAFAGTNEVHIRDNWGKPTAENLEVQNAYNQIFEDGVLKLTKLLAETATIPVEKVVIDDEGHKTRTTVNEPISYTELINYDYINGYDKKKAIEAEIFKGMDKYINSDGTVKTANALFE